MAAIEIYTCAHNMIVWGTSGLLDNLQTVGVCEIVDVRLLGACVRIVFVCAVSDMLLYHCTN